MITSKSLVLALIFACAALSGRAGNDLKTERLVLVTLDGVRCEELFGGLDLSVMKHFAGKKALKDISTYRQFWDSDPEMRRVKLWPFFWGQLMVEHGSVMGNAQQGSVVQLRNRWRVSYPGYSEIVTGRVDDRRIKSNDPVYNPNESVLEGLLHHRGLGYHQVAVFASWDVMRFIVQREENTLFCNTGFQVYESANPLTRSLSRLQFETRTPWDSVRSDAYTFRFAMQHFETYLPEVLFLALGETDDWAHEKRYDRVLESIHQADDYLRQLWRWIEQHDEYAGRTTLLITTDHGRGRTPFTWQHHNDKLPGAKNTWLAVVSPDVSKRGEWAHHRGLESREIAATLARFGGYDFAADRSEVAGPIEFLFTED